MPVLSRTLFLFGSLVLPAACVDEPITDDGASLTVEPSLLEFADSTTCADPAVTSATLHNAGSVATGLLRPRLEGRDAPLFRIVASTCDAILLPGASCTVKVSVQSRGQVKLDAMLVAGDAADQVAALVTAPAAVNGHLDVVESDRGFGRVFVGLSQLLAPRRNVVIRNTGAGALPPIDFKLAGGAFHLLSSTCGDAPLCGGTACTATIDFRPTEVGAQASQLSVHAGAAQWIGAFTGTGEPL